MYFIAVLNLKCIDMWENTFQQIQGILPTLASSEYWISRVGDTFYIAFADDSGPKNFQHLQGI